MDLSSTVIITPRLKIIPVTEKYVQEIFTETTPEVTKYLSFDNSGNIEDIFKFIKTSQSKMKAGEGMSVAILDKSTGEFIGCGGIDNINTRKPTLGIWIKKSAQGKGFGKETIQAFIDWIEINIPYEYIFYPVVKNNIRSRKLIESFGGILQEERVVTSPSGKVLDEVVYALFYSSKLAV
jgi:RimJ/RimL family protein N-acetyltransferase